MEGHQNEEIEAMDEEEYVLLDIDDACGQVRIPAGTSYVLSGLDTLTPTLIFGDGTKLIGEYQETIGTCYVFSETEGVNVVKQSGTGPSDTNLIKDTCIVDPNQPSKEIKPIASLQRVLKFKLATEAEDQSADKKP